jgi:DNA processing protein
MQKINLENKHRYWIAFNLVFAEKLKEAGRLFKTFSKIEEIFKLSVSDLTEIGIDKENAKKISSPQSLDSADRELEWLSRNHYSVLTIEDEKYPGFLREIYDPPYVLYYAGTLDGFEKPMVSIVGSRRPSPYGLAVAERLAEDLASYGIVVVSGMAKGVDSAAHWGALKNGQTIAVLGSGLDRIYPKENKNLMKKIMENGLVLTEYHHKSPPLGQHFPLRNRIISGLSLALVVAEAAQRSGSLISARLALEENREVMAVPGNVTSSLSQGTNWLIKNGAKLVEDWKDVIEDLPSPYREDLLTEARRRKREEKTVQIVLNEQEKQIMELLCPDSLIHIDKLVEKSAYSVSEILSILLSLELKGLIIQRPGKFFQRKL